MKKAQSLGVGLTLGKIVVVRLDPLSSTKDAPAVAEVAAEAVADRRAKPAAVAEAAASSPSGRDDDGDDDRRKPYP